MRFQCSECQKIISVDDELCGQDVACADCSGIAGVMTTIHVPDTHLSPRATLGGFVLGEKLEENEDTLTFAATQISLDRPVTVTVLRPELMQVEEARDAFIEAIREVAHKPGPQPREPLSVAEYEGYLFYAAKTD